MKLQRFSKRDRSLIRAKAPTMKSSYRIKRNYKAASSARDLFGGMTVTEADVHAWVSAVARLDPASRRGIEYARAYNVAEKVARAKANGTFWQIIEQNLAPRGF